MIELISIHIPKTGGTSFYHILQQVYGDKLSISYKRKDYKSAVQHGGEFSKTLPQEVSVLHGHFYYSEIKALHENTNAKVICWLRDPVERVISNYRHFKKGLSDPKRNPDNYKLNRHRVNESLLEYASLAENRNRMTAFLDGIRLEELFFFGLLESFEQDIERLMHLLRWSAVDTPKLNSSVSKTKLFAKPDYETKKAIAKLNSQDYELYVDACQLLGIANERHTNFR